MKVLVVGAGFAGAVHARVAAEAGHDVLLIDAAPHLGGAAHDRMMRGLRVHSHGPHLFHTRMPRVLAWLSRFTDWTAYTHRAMSRLPCGTLVPFPLNADSLAALQKLGYPTAPHGDASPPGSAEAWLRTQISPEMVELLFARYVARHWALPLAALPARVVQRVAPRMGREDRYFPRATFRGLPKDGYTALFANMVRHPRITCTLGTPYSEDLRARSDLCLTSMSMDSFYGPRFGPLPYRAVRFETVAAPPAPPQIGTVNLTDHPQATREHHWHHITGAGQGGPPLITREYPGTPASHGGARHYPVHTLHGAERAILARYQTLAKAEARHLRFIGRCGTFRYLNMDQVVSQSLAQAYKLFGQRPAARKAS